MVGQGKVPRFHWNDLARMDLLLAIFRHANPTPAQWDRIIEDTSKKGYHFNANAAQQHLMKLKKKDENVAGKAIAMREASHAQFEREQEERGLASAGINTGPAAGAGRRATRPGAHNSGKSKGSNGAGTKRGLPDKDTGDDAPSDSESDDDDTGRRPTKKSRKNRDTAQHNREGVASRGARSNNGDSAKGPSKKKRTDATSVASDDFADEHSSETAPDLDSPQPETGDADAFTSGHPAFGFGRSRTIAPPPNWARQSAHGFYPTQGPSAHQSATAYVNQSIENAEGADVSPPAYSSIVSQSRGLTMAPDPHHPSELQAETEDHNGAENFPWYMV